MRTVSQVIAAAKAQVAHPSRDWTGWCLAFTRTAWGIAPTGIDDANDAWQLAKTKQKTNQPPAGAPVYWQVGPHGHIAVSAGGGKVYSTDILRKGKVDLVPITTVNQKWGAHYRGWSRDYCGHALPIGATAATASGPGGGLEPFPGDAFFHDNPSSPIITAMGKRLVAEGCGTYKDGPGPRWSDADHASYKAWQEKLGYTGGDADGWPGKTSWDKLKVPAS